MTDAPTIGHNRGPRLPTEARIDEYLEAEYSPVIKRAADLLDAESRFINVGSDEADSAATEFMVKVRAAWKLAESNRSSEKTPYDVLAGRVHAFFKTKALDPLQALGERINQAQTDYKKGVLRAEMMTREAAAARAAAAEKAAKEKADADAKAARDAEIAAARARKPERVEELAKVAEAARETAQASQAGAQAIAVDRIEADQALAAPAADLTRSRGGRGGVASLATFVEVLELDRTKLVPRGIELLLPYIPEAALLKAAKDYEKANKATVAAHIKAGTDAVPGVTYYEDMRNRGRS